ncbi:MEDS domain-containing protein [Actinokineospora auranticolor]|uniref:DcmR-like sensory protein n=1 Tax=Actinokineospora auranticolor TaxID=155976 RepID=A0A2S6GDD5_9PSEU|nr:MEDS domain-containing protein [Actinokineospora auranticolor]PPK63243.1 DcmR-like sensory protein [Actinokineospora auranticolor]
MTSPTHAGRGHQCWSFADRAEFVARAGRFLAGGLESGQRVCYIGSGGVPALTAQLRGVGGFDDAVDSGAAQVVALDGLYPSDRVLDPVAQVQVYAAATRAALAAGYRGLRVAADATDLVRGPARLAAFARYEHLADRYMAGHPFEGMCAFDRAALHPDDLARLACLHPDGHPTPFRLHARTRAGDFALDGEVDGLTRDLLPWALEHALPGVERDGELVVDATGLRFIDHRGLLTIAEHATRGGRTAVLRTRWSGAARIAAILTIPGMRVEVVA